MPEEGFDTFYNRRKKELLEDGFKGNSSKKKPTKSVDKRALPEAKVLKVNKDQTPQIDPTKKKDDDSFRITRFLQAKLPPKEK